jgi:hypothetical protein
MTKYVFLLTILLVYLLLVPVLQPFIKEGFSSLTPGNFPVSVSKPLLHGYYPVKKTVSLSKEGSEESYRKYSNKNDLDGSYKQATNNIRFWRTPDNGKCKPASFCGALYSDKKIKHHKTPTAIPFSNPCKRVGFYCSEN